MAKAKYERTKPHVNIGTIGHVDHGKTTLTLCNHNCIVQNLRWCRCSIRPNRQSSRRARARYHNLHCSR